MVAQLITVSPVRLDSAVDASTIHAPHASSDLVITKQSIKQARRQPHLAHPLSAHIEALIVRTLPNDRQQKAAVNHSGTNPPFFHQEAAEYIGGLVRHLLTDLPSVDREQDGGKLLAHRALLLRDSEPRTITEFCYVKDHVPDGVYMLNLQIMPFESDAAPARPVLHEIQWN
jgi:kynurenine formamidase